MSGIFRHAHLHEWRTSLLALTFDLDACLNTIRPSTEVTTIHNLFAPMLRADVLDVFFDASGWMKQDERHPNKETRGKQV